MGKQNAFHLIVDQPDPAIVELLLSQNVNYDLPDQKNQTPFNLYSTRFQNEDSVIRQNQIQFSKALVERKIQFDLPDHKGRTAFLNYFGNSRIKSAIRLLDMGASVNQIDASGLYALKYALIRRDGKQIDMLVRQYNANINLLDQEQRNCLHHAVNMSSATADATFETE